MTSKFWAAAFTLTGTIIGAGILGLPYVFSRAGFLFGLFWLLFLGIIMVFVSLCLGEVSLRTDKIYQLPGYAEKYLGKKGKWLMFFAFAFGIYSALIAYLIGEGQSFSQIFFGNLDYAIYFAVGFWLIMTLLLQEGLKGLKKIETWGVFAIIIIVIGILIFYIKDISFLNLSYVDYSNFFLPFGVVLFALLGFTSIPELRRIIKGEEKKLKKAIIIGALIPIILYILFAFVFVGLFGIDVPEVATLALGNIVIILGIFTMMTSYFVLSFSLKDSFDFDWKLDKFWCFLFVSLLPLILYLIIYYFNLAGFIRVLGIGGVISGGATGILILLMNLKAKRASSRGKGRKSEFSVPLNWVVVILLSLIFIFGVVVELFF